MVYHVENTCDEIQAEKKLKEINDNIQPEDDQLVEWAKKVGAKQCSKCKYWVHKSDGCDHMTCRCGHEFCYICGG